MKNANDDNDYAFLMDNEIHFKSMCKWNMNMGAFKHITSHIAACDTYKVITPRNVHLDDNNIFLSYWNSIHCRGSNLGR